MQKKLSIFLLFSTTLFLLAGISGATAQTVRSTNAAGNWYDAVWDTAPTVVDDVEVDHTIIVPNGETVEVNNLHVGSKGKLQVYGNLIINGNVTMANNSPEFSMFSSAVVVVYGNFNASNKIDISVSSYLIIHGNFTKDGASNQGDLSVDNGNIYIFGEVDPNWTELQTCGGSYDGTTTTTGEPCDYGTEEDYLNNQETIPPELQELITCFSITKLEDVNACEASNVTWTIDPIANVSYEWQGKNVDASWSTIPGADSNTLTLSSVTTAFSGRKYRVVLRSTDTSINCKVGVSNAATLTVYPNDFKMGAITGDNSICYTSGSEYTYSIPEVPGIKSYSWNIPAGWTITSGAGTSTITLAPDSTPGVKTIEVTATPLCGESKIASLDVYINDFITGPITGETSICYSEGTTYTYSIPEVTDVDTYQWTIPTGWTISSGSNSNTITVIPDAASGDKSLSVTATNLCGVSNTASLGVKVMIPDFTIEPIDGEPSICYSEGTPYTYSIPEVTDVDTYQWTIPTGWTISSGSNSNIITVIPDAASGDKSISVTATNLCGVSNIVSLDINVEIPGVWTGLLDSDWNIASNWSCNLIPDNTTNVLIPAGTPNNPVIYTGTNALSNDLQIESGVILTVLQDLQISGDLIAAGLINAENGSLSFTGSSVQNIPSGAFENNRIKNLQVNNSAGVNNQAELEITGILKVASGIFSTGDLVTLISDASGTALIDGSGKGQITGTLKMQRFLDPAFGYKYFSSPFSNSVVGDFSSYVDLSAAFPQVFKYNENREDSQGNDATGWEVYTSSAAPLEVGKGYAFNFGNSSAAKTVELSGTVNNGDVSLLLENHNGFYTKGFNLVGNPYPSPIDWNSAGWTKQNIDDAIYFFTAGSEQYTGIYTSFVNGISSSDGKATSIIPSMQGFFVKVSDGYTSGTLGMTNAVRSLDATQAFLKSSNRSKEQKLLRLYGGFDGEAREDALVIYFPAFAKPEFETKLDAHKMMNTDNAVPSIYSISKDNKELSINALSLETETVVKIPLGVQAERAGRMYFKMANLPDLAREMHYYLIDLQKKKSLDLSKDPVYSFTIEKGIHNQRFQLMISSQTVADPAIVFDEPFRVKIDASGIGVQLFLEKGQLAHIQKANISGQILESKTGSGYEEIRFDNTGSEGMYFVILDISGRRYTKKVIIKK
ncbi:hypothetical protein [Salinimicrobium soli]|uniref:hypothetical protein n=1 Tax=Salinimicrobium soli TaxID=1254399 RepID=UPI003AAFE339